MTDAIGNSETQRVASGAHAHHAGHSSTAVPSAMRDPSSHLRLWLFAVVGLAIDLWTKHLAFQHLSVDPRDEAGVVVENIMALRRSLNPGALFGLGKGLVPLFIVASILALTFVLYMFRHSTRDRRSLHVALGLVLAGALGNLYDRTFVIADVVKVEVTNRQTGEVRTGYHAGTIVNEGPGAVDIVEGLLKKPEGEAWVKVQPHIQTVRKSSPGERIVDRRRQGVVRDFIKMEPQVAGYRIWPWVFNLADTWLVLGVGLLLLNFWWDHKAEKAAEAAAAEPPSPPE